MALAMRSSTTGFQLLSCAQPASTFLGTPVSSGFPGSLPFRNKRHGAWHPVATSAQMPERQPSFGTSLDSHTSIFANSTRPADADLCRQPVSVHYACDDGDLVFDEIDVVDDLLRWSGEDGSSIASLERSYITHAAIGRVECNSKGCRPILDDRPLRRQISPNDWVQGGAASGIESRTSEFHLRSALRDCMNEKKAPISLEFAQFLDEVWCDKVSAEKQFEAGLQASPSNSRLLTAFAKFCWKELNDTVRAEGLYKRALEVAPENAEALASYALFLWESES